MTDCEAKFRDTGYRICFGLLNDIQSGKFRDIQPYVAEAANALREAYESGKREGFALAAKRICMHGMSCTESTCDAHSIRALADSQADSGKEGGK